MLNNLTLSSSFYPVVALKLFVLYSSRLYTDLHKVENDCNIWRDGVTDDVILNCTWHAMCNATQVCCMRKLRDL